MKASFQSHRSQFFFLVLTLLAGAALRIAVFFQNRSLFLDEANLARNIVERSGWDFFRPLSYEQFAPPLFSWLVKGGTLLLGNTEFGLRLIPLLAALASLYLFYRIAVILIPAFPAQWLAVWVFSFHGQLLRYATECKQYGTDVFAALFFIFLTLRQSERSFGWKQALAWALGGSVMIWFSMPLVFVLSGVGVFLLVHFWKKKDKIAIWGTGLSIFSWLMSFCLFFFLLLKPDADSDFLQQYHSPYFLPLFPNSIQEWGQLGKLLGSLLKDFAGITAFAQVAGAVGLSTAWFVWGIRRNAAGLLFGLPVLACLLASGMHYYSLISRLALFLVPLLLLTSAAGLGFLWGKSNPWIKAAVVLAILAMGSLHTSFRNLISPYQISEIRPALEFVEKAQQPGDRLFLYKWAAPPFDFYTRLHSRPMQFLDKDHFENKLEIPIACGDRNLQFHRRFPPKAGTAYEVNFCKDPKRPIVEDLALEGDRIWLVYNHLLSRETNEEMEADLARLRELGEVREAFRAKGAAVWLWSKQSQ